MRPMSLNSLKSLPSLRASAKQSRATAGELDCFRLRQTATADKSSRSLSSGGHSPGPVAPCNDVDAHGAPPNDHVVPALRRDPYAVCSRFGSVADAFLDNPRQGLGGPARRPGRPGWVARIHFSNSNLCTDMVSRSRDSIRPSYANSSAPKREGAGKTGCALHPRSHVQK
jgi:hypothetical protein